MIYVKSLFLFLILYINSFFISVNCSRDYDTYIELMDSDNPPDLFISYIISIGKFFLLPPEAIYSIYLSINSILLVYLFVSRRFTCYWILIYLINFFPLHVITQIRVCTASVLISLIWTRRNYFLSLLSPFIGLVHSSAAIYSPLVFFRGNIKYLFLVPLSAYLGAYFSSGSKKYISYYNDNNEANVLSVAFFIFLLFTGLSLISNLSRNTKRSILLLSFSTLFLYNHFLSFGAVSNRFAELNSSVLLLLFGARSICWGTPGSFVDRSVKLVILIVSFLAFLYYNLFNSILMCN